MKFLIDVLKYVETNDLEWMRQCIRELLALMPLEVQTTMNSISWITK